MMEKFFDSREILQGTFEFACQRPDGSIYGIAPEATCRKGVPVDPKSVGITPENWRKIGEVYGPETAAAVAEIDANLKKLSPEQRAPWEKAIPQMCVNTKITTGTSRMGADGKMEVEPESAYDGQMASRVKGYNKLLVDGPPSKIKLRNGELVDAENLQPIVSNRGGTRWVDPVSGLRYSHKGKDIAEQTGFGIIDRERVLDDVVAHRAKNQNNSSLPKNALGGTWPVQKLADKSKQLDPDEIIAGLSKREKDTIIWNGLSKTAYGTPQHDVAMALGNNSAMQQKRLREVVERYAEQGGLSGITGKPVALPGLKPKRMPDGRMQERSSVDHFDPISGATSVKNGGSVAAIRKSHDKKSNFLIAEEAPNSQRGNREWSGEVDKWVKARAEKASKLSKQPQPDSFVGLKQLGLGPEPKRRGRGSSSSKPAPAASTGRGPGRPRKNKAEEKPKVENKKVPYANWSKAKFERALDRAIEQGNQAEISKLLAAMGNKFG